MDYEDNEYGPFFLSDDGPESSFLGTKKPQN